MSGVLSYDDLFNCYPTGCGYGITFNPQNALSLGGQYTVTLTGIRNYSGYVMASDYTWSFTVLPVGSGTWQPTATTNAPSPRYDHTAIWTGSEMIVWGGKNAGSVTNTGARYDPANDAWQPTSTQNAPVLYPAYGHAAVWTGSEMIVWGADISGANIGGRYHPASDTWRGVTNLNAPAGTSHTAVWTGNRMVVWGGNSGGIYDPVSDSWQHTSLANAPLGQKSHTAVWTGTEMIIWGGTVPIGGGRIARTNTGGRYNPVTDTWIAMSTLGAPEPRESHTAVWTGSKMVVWGGWGNSYLNSGGVYDPATDTWQTVPITDAPPARSSHTAIWSGNEMIVWGGTSSGAIYLNNGARYDPIASTWTATSNINPPASRVYHSSAWTGSQMVIWGGHIGAGINLGTDAGGRYTP